MSAERPDGLTENQKKTGPLFFSGYLLTSPFMPGAPNGGVTNNRAKYGTPALLSGIMGGTWPLSPT